MLSMYPACFIKETDGSYSVIFPDLNFLSTCGDSVTDAMSMAVDCLAGYIFTCKQDGDAIPEPSDINKISIEKVLKDISSDSLASDCFVNIVTVDVNAYAKEHFEKPVKKTLTIPSWLNDAACEMNINFSRVLQEALISKLQQLKH